VGRYAAFLRGVNLAGRRKTPSAALRAAFEEAGFEDVATFRASGNVVFSTTRRQSEAKLAAETEAALLDAFGFEVVVFLRTEAECRAIAKHRPFPEKEVERSGGKLQVDLLLKKPAAAARKKVLAMATADDRLAIRGRELYWLPRGGMMDSDLDLSAIDGLIGPTTKRTMGTVESMVAKLFD
jgi:uncharacterized protein (DUF1697 family)